MKRLRAAAIIAALLIAAVPMLLWGSANVPADNIDSAEYVPSESSNESAIAKGRYLALAGNCFSCHTAQEHSPYAGGVPFYTAFGTIYSTNITPDRATGIGDWTLREFTNAMRRGIGKDGEHLYPAFPYSYFTKMSDEDLDALFAFLRTLKPVEQKPREHDLKFPLNHRAVLGGWKMLFFREQRFEPDEQRTAEQNRGAYLVESLGHCGACHTPRNFLGAEKSGLPLAGGELYDYLPTGDIRAWSTINLTSHETGLKHWTRRDVVSYLKTGHSKRATALGPMNEVIANSTRHLTDEDVQAMAAYLKELRPLSRGDVGRVDDRQLRSGELLYVANCGSCHLLDGAGSEQTAPALQGSPLVQAHSPTSLINVVLHGPPLTEALPGGTSRPDMPTFDAKLSDEQIALLTTYVRNAWGNQASAVSPEQVAEQR